MPDSIRSGALAALARARGLRLLEPCSWECDQTWAEEDPWMGSHMITASTGDNWQRGFMMGIDAVVSKIALPGLPVIAKSGRLSVPRNVLYSAGSPVSTQCILRGIETRSACQLAT